MDAQAVERARGHIRNAWIAGLISAAATLLLAVWGHYSEYIRLKFGFDAWSLLDVAIILGLTYGVYRSNRWCAATLLVYVVVAAISQAAAAESIGGGVGALIFGYLFLRGTISAFQLHHRERHAAGVGPQRVGFAASMALGVGAVLLALLAALIYLGTVSPPIEVIPGRLLQKTYVDGIKELGLLQPDEPVHYWYSDGILDYREGFYFFTDRKVVVYSETFEEPAIVVPYPEIADIKLNRDPSFLEDSRITILLHDGTEVFFPVSSEHGGDEKYYDSLLASWRAAQAE